MLNKKAVVITICVALFSISAVVPAGAVFGDQFKGMLKENRRKHAKKDFAQHMREYRSSINRLNNNSSKKTTYHFKSGNKEARKVPQYCKTKGK